MADESIGGGWATVAAAVVVRSSGGGYEEFDEPLPRPVEPLAIPSPPARMRRHKN